MLRDNEFRGPKTVDKFILPVYRLLAMKFSVVQCIKYMYRKYKVRN